MNLEPFRYRYVALAEDFTFKANLQYFLQAKLSYLPSGMITATPLAGRGSGDLANLVDADGFLELPAEKTVFLKGEVYGFIGYR
jgi:molybdopterin molybdotransferase